ncbi:MAG: efflux RND transporter periplasmic adaptor subunit, partial [bacterium]
MSLSVILDLNLTLAEVAASKVIMGSLRGMTRNRCNVFCNAVLAIVGLAAFNTVAAESSRVMLLSDIALHPQRSAPATALSLNESTLSSQLLARVQTIHVRVSQSVKKNDRLLTLDCADYNLQKKMADARHKAAESRWDLAKNQLARAEKLIVKELASQELLDNRRVESTARQAEFDEADVARQRARLDVERCNIAAPFDGVVISRLAGEGELASVGTPLMELVDVQGVELSASVNFEDARLLDQAQEFFFDYGNRLPVKLRNLGA